VNEIEAWDYLCTFNPKPTSYTKHNLKRCLKVIEWLPQKKAKVLDLGSDRYFPLLLAKTHPEYEVHCSGLKAARGAPSNCSRMDEIQDASQIKSFSYFDVERDTFPYEDASFDIVFCLELIEHLPSDPVFMMREINRILKPGGILLLTTPNMLSWRSILDSIAGIYPMEHMKYYKELGFPQHIREYSPWEVQRLCEESGFRISKLKTFEVTNTRKLNLWERFFSLIFYAFIPLLMRHPKFLFNRNPKIFVLGHKTSKPNEDAGAFLYIGKNLDTVL
jgi:SAM-dependent methyltransferase